MQAEAVSKQIVIVAVATKVEHAFSAFPGDTLQHNIPNETTFSLKSPPPPAQLSSAFVYMCLCVGAYICMGITLTRGP